MIKEESLEIWHKDSYKCREWDFSELGKVSELRDLLKVNFSRYLYKSPSEGLSDVKEGKSFEVDTTQYGQQGVASTIIKNIPCSYFKQEGYNRIVSFIDNEYKKTDKR